MKDTKFLTFIRIMFSENCLERSQYGEEEYPNVEAYYQKNKEFLRREYSKKLGEK